MRRQRRRFSYQPREPHGRNPVQDLKGIENVSYQRRRAAELRRRRLIRERFAPRLRCAASF